MEISLVLNGVILPLTATFIVPKEAKKNGFSSPLILFYLLTIAVISFYAYPTREMPIRLSVCLGNSILVFVGAKAFVFLEDWYLKRKRK